MKKAMTHQQKYELMCNKLLNFEHDFSYMKHDKHGWHEKYGNISINNKIN